MKENVVESFVAIFVSVSGACSASEHYTEGWGTC